MTHSQRDAPPAAGLPTGDSPAIRRVNRLIGQVAGFDSTVLILGESGTGKEVVARAIHDCSARAHRPFVAINCGAIPGELLESELFGHEKGSFTGALAARRGRFELAEGGTIFLDEIGDMPVAMQVKLLRVLQERVFERVGGNAVQRCDVRIIAATHRDLDECMSRGTFREDLYYRLSVVPIEVPSLRERATDLPQLVAALVEQLPAARAQRLRLLPETLAALQRYRWPGNVRELANLLERLSVQSAGRPVAIADLPARYQPGDFVLAPQAEDELLATGIIADAGMGDPLAGLKCFADEQPAGQPAADAVAGTAPDAVAHAAAELAARQLLAAGAISPPAPATLPAGGMDLRAYLENLERGLICQALEAAGGTVAQAARLLGLRRTTLVEKLRKYGLAGGELSATGT